MSKADYVVLFTPSLLKQNFMKLGSRFYLYSYARGLVYVAAVIDLFSRAIVGLYMSDRMTNDLVINALNR